MPFDRRYSTTNFSYIYYKQREKPGLVGALEKKFQNHISGFFAQFAGFTHIHNNIAT